MTLGLSNATGLFVAEDSGAPAGSTDYTTLVVLHGYSWVIGTFSKLIPFSEKYNTRVILVNRRDYRDARPLSEAERALLPVITHELESLPGAIASATRKIDAYMNARAKEVYDLLAELAIDEKLPRADFKNGKGGIIVVGWSFAGAWMNSLLAHVSSFSRPDVDLNEYVRRVVVFDSPYHTIGYSDPEGIEHRPFFDPKLSPEEQGRAFSTHVSGYYIHGDTPDKLELDTPLANPSPGFLRLAEEDIKRLQFNGPGLPGGSDSVLLDSGLKLGLFAALKQAALYLPARGGGAWRDAEVRFVFCERSWWEVRPGLWALTKEVQEAKQKGLPLRNVRIVQIRGENHFVSWENPEVAMRAFVGDEDEVRSPTPTSV
ncbi:hypothetical protein C8Q78DRAFT_1049662 [Trametes maxima]|nr:hypothetical protein C8Q78DRAFT_1049662 [Trametes maxima]